MSRKKALLSVAALSALALAQWFLASESVPAAPAAGSFIVAQNPPPKCGQDPQHPCPKAAPQPAPKAPAQQPPPPPPRQQAQPQQPPPPPPPKQAQPKQEPQIEHKPAVVQQPPAGQPQLKQEERKPVVQQPPAGQPQLKQEERKPVVQQPPAGQPQLKQEEHRPVVQQPPAGQPQPQGQQPQPQQGQQRPPPGPPPGQQRIQPAQGQPAQPQPGQPQPKQTFQRVQPPPGRPGQPATPAIANVQDLRAQRHEHTEPGGAVVIEEPDHRQIVREGGQVFVRHDENERLFAFGEGRRERRADGNYSIIARPDGDEIITVTDDDGRLIRRFRRERDGREFILIDNRRPRGEAIFLNLPVPIIGIPQDQYIVDTAVAPEPFIYQTLEAPPLVPIERPYSLDEIRYNVALRDRMRRIDVDTINFDFGSWEVAADQVARLQLVAQAIGDIVARNPNEVFLIEGHTDAVGQDVDNLSLSDRRAETVAGILTENFQIPPENLTTQGYGAHFLKIQTPDANRQNRRVTVRRITPLLAGSNG